MKIRKLPALLTAAVLCAGSLPAAAQEESGLRHVRIPYGYNDFLTLDEAGEPAGYYAPYFDALAKVNGWEYEYISVSWSEAMQMLRADELDILYPTSYTEERDGFMDFSTLPTGYLATGLFALGSSDFAYEDFAGFDGARISVIRDTAYEPALERFAAAHDFSYIPVYTDNNTSAIEDVRSGRAELAVFNAAAIFPDAELVSLMEAEPVFLTVREGNDELRSEIDSGMQQLLRLEPELVARTMRMTFSGQSAAAIALDREEREFIDAGHTVRVGMYEESEPLAYVNADGAPDGVYHAVLTEIRERSGLPVEVVSLSRSQDWQEVLEQGEIDFFIGVSDSSVPADGRFRLTDPFMEYTNVLVTRNDCAFGQIAAPVLALTHGRAEWSEALEGKLENAVIRVKYFDTAKDCLLAVADGKADAALLNNLEFNYHIKNDRLATLIRWPQYRFPTQVRLVACSNCDDVMFSTMNKLVRLPDEQFVDTQIESFLNLPYHSYTLADHIYNARNPLIAAGTLVILVIMTAWLMLAYRKKQGQLDEKTRQREQKQLRIMAALSDDYMAVFVIDLDEDRTELVRISKEVASIPPDGESHSEVLREYAQSRVLEEYRNEMLVLTDPEAMKERLKKNGHFVIRYQLVPEIGSGLHYEMHITDISQDDEKHWAVLGIRCIDAEVEAELEQRRNLQDALDIADRANAERLEFMMKLDIRTPMKELIDLSLDAKAHMDDSTHVSDRLDELTIAGRRLLQQVDDVLKAGSEMTRRTDSGESCDLEALLLQLTAEMLPQAEVHEHRLRFIVEELAHPRVLCDPQRIRQIFMHLVSNAIRYTPDGGDISVTLREQPGEPGGGQYQLLFADDGIGMTPKFIASVTSPRREDAGKGSTGLGLSLTSSIVRMMGGTLEIESELGRGSVVTVTLPLSFAEHTDP